MDISEIVRRLASARTLHAYYSAYDDKEAQRDRDETAAEIVRYEDLLREEVAALRGQVAAVNAEMPCCTNGCPRLPLSHLPVTDMVCAYRRTCELLAAATKRGNE